MSQYVTYQLTRDETDVFLSQDQAARDAPPRRGRCDHCGRARVVYPRQDSPQQWCGTCLSREARRVNTRERAGRGRRGY